MGLPSNIIDFEAHRPVNPQKEDGYMAIANEILDALCQAYIPARERQCLDYILRKTYGWDKKTDKISLSQFEKGTGLSKRQIRTCLSALSDKNLIGVHVNVHTPKGKKEFLPSTYWFNKRYDTWLAESTRIKGMHVKGHRVCTSTVQGVCTSTCTTIDTITKDNNSRHVSKNNPPLKTFSPELCKFVEAFVGYVVKEKGNKAPKIDQSLISKSCTTVDRLVRIDGFDLDYVKGVCRWAIQDDFYSTNFFSLAPLRKKSKNGATKFVNMAAKFDKDPAAQKHKKPKTDEEIMREAGL